MYQIFHTILGFFGSPAHIFSMATSEEFGFPAGHVVLGKLAVQLLIMAAAVRGFFCLVEKISICSLNPKE